MAEKGSTRLEEVLGVQQQAVERVSKFAGKVAKMTTDGNYAPSQWINAYTGLWKDLSTDMVGITRALFEPRASDLVGMALKLIQDPQFAKNFKASPGRSGGKRRAKRKPPKRLPKK